MSFDEREKNVRMTRRRQQKENMRRKLFILGTSAAVILLIGAGAGAYYLYEREDVTAQTKPTTSIERTETIAKTTETTESTSTVQSSAKEQEAVNQELQTILTSYSEKIDQKTPILLDEFHTEIQSNSNGLTGISTIANQKANALQAVANEGIQKMQEKYHNAGSLETVDLNSWISQLSAKYTEQVARISAALLQTRAAFQATQQTETTAASETTDTEQMASSETTESSTDEQNYAQASPATTVVQAGEGPNQVAERTGVPVERLLELNGMTKDDFFLNPGQVLRLH